MLTSKVAKRYAQGLLDFTEESSQTQMVRGEMLDVINIMNTSKDLNNLFLSPVVDSKKKQSIAKEIFKAFSPVSQNIIQLVIKQGRESHLKDIATEFINRVEEMEGLQKVVLTTASPISDSIVEQIISQSNLVNTSGNYRLDKVVNKELLGGYVLRVGDQQLDASVRSKLNQIKKDFQLN